MCQEHPGSPTPHVPAYVSSFCSLQPAWSSAAPRFPLPPVCRHAELHAASCSPAHPDTKSCAAAASAQLLRVGEGGRVLQEGQRGEGGRCCLLPLGAASWHRGAILSCLLVVFKGTAFNTGALRIARTFQGFPKWFSTLRAQRASPAYSQPSKITKITFLAWL